MEIVMERNILAGQRMCQTSYITVKTRRKTCQQMYIDREILYVSERCSMVEGTLTEDTSQ